jgi:hypothetical protein
MKMKWLHSGFFAHHRIEILMWGLIVEMLASPLADSHPRIGALLGFVVLVMVLVGIREIAKRTFVENTLIPLAVIWMITRIMEAFGDRSKFYANLSPLAGVVFSCSIVWAIFNHFHSRSRNLRTAIAEAAFGYLIVATAFSQVYWILNRLVDHAFNQVIPLGEHATFLYFSMVTITSVGYGGIVPLNPYIRMVAALESMCGIFFVAVVVARVVSSYGMKTARHDASLAQETEPGRLDLSSEGGYTATLDIVSASADEGSAQAMKG